MDEGVVYIVFTNTKNKNLASNHYFKELEVSVNSLKSIHMKLPVTLLTDEDVKIDGIDNVIKIEPTSMRMKHTLLFPLSPYRRTLYLDSDTKIVGPIDEIFDLLDNFDLAATQDLIRKDERKSKKYRHYAEIPDGFPEYGGGVLLFESNMNTSDFFERWMKNFEIWYNLTGEMRDQPSLRVSIWECISRGLKFHTLPPEFNVRTKKYDNIINRIMHCHS